MTTEEFQAITDWGDYRMVSWYDSVWDAPFTAWGVISQEFMGALAGHDAFYLVGSLKDYFILHAEVTEVI